MSKPALQTAKKRKYQLLAVCQGAPNGYDAKCLFQAFQHGIIQEDPR